MWEVCEALQLYIVFNCIVIQYVHAMYSLYLCPFATSIDMAITYDYGSKSNGVWAGLHVVCTYSTVCKYVGTYVCKLLLVSTYLLCPCCRLPSLFTPARRARSLR